MAHVSIPKIPSAEHKTFTLGEVAALTGLSVGTLYNLMTNDRLRTIKIGGRRLVACEVLDVLLRVSDESKGSDFNKVGPS